jgi:hypothetical protein
MQRLLRDSHETGVVKAALRKRAWQLFRSLVARRVVEFIPMTDEGARLRVNVDLQDDFSMDQTLSLYLIETLPQLDAASPEFALDVLTLVESILENPELILRRQLDRIKDRAVAQMKADGVEYEQRMEELEKLEYPKPLRDFVYQTFNAFADTHPWVGEENIRPKSIAREMFENFRSFDEYVLDYELQRSEGLLLRHLNSVYKVLSQTVPDGLKTSEVTDVELYLRTLLSQVDSSLADEWERMRDPSYQPLAAGLTAARPPGTETVVPDVTRDAKAFTAAIRALVFTFLRAWSTGRHAAALEALDTLPSVQPEGGAWTAERLRSALEHYRVDHDGVRLDPEARNIRHTHVIATEDGRTWRVEQVLVDAEQHNDWMVECEVDLQASREANRPVLWLRGIRPIG